MKFERTFRIESARADEHGHYEFALSSETPVERMFGDEILVHSPEAVDLARLADGRHPLLLNHDPERQIGVVARAWLDNEARKVRVRTRFSRSALGQEIRQDVEDDIRTLVSVGYFIESVREERTQDDGTVAARDLSGDEFEREMRALHGDHFYRAAGEAGAGEDGRKPRYLVTRWVPFEASVVPIPADVNTGKGRAADSRTEPKPEAPREQRAATVETQRKEIIVMDEVKQQQPAKPADADTAERQRVADIIALGEQYAKYIPQKAVSDAVRNGRSVESVKDAIMKAMEERHATEHALDLGMTQKEVKRYSFGRALQAAISGDWSKAGFERECSQALEKAWGRTPEGFFVPFEFMRRDFNVGTTTEAGNLVQTTVRPDLYVDALRNAMVLGGLGVRILAGVQDSLTIPRKSTASTLGTLTEIGSGSETNPLTASLSLSPKRVGAYVEVSKQAIIQSALALENMIRDDLVMGAAVQIEYLAINGNGTSPQHAGIRNTTGIGTVVGGTNGLAPAWSHFVDLESACANANAEPDRLAGYLINTKTRGKAKQTQKGTNLPFIWDNGPQPLNGYRAAVSNNVPSNLTKGTSTTVASSIIFSSDWSMDVIALFGGADVTVDPYSKADTGQVKITLNQFADSGVRQPGAFAKMDDALSG